MTNADAPWTSNFVEVDGVTHHYLEAGDPSAETVVLIHSGEFGAAAQFSWEYAIPALAPEYHVIAPDLVGYGQTSKLFDFADPLGFRIKTVTGFCAALGIENTHFMGNSMGGTLMCYVATMADCPWPMRTMVLASGGGKPAENDYRRQIQDYDGSAEQMDTLIALTYTRRWYDDEHVRRRVEMSRITGNWETLSAARLKAPWREARSALSPFQDLQYQDIKIPTAVFAGGEDKFRDPGYEDELEERIPDVEVHRFPNAGHMLHIEFADEFNQLALDFLRRHPQP